MKTTLALYLKNLVSKIHPPLPLTPRESQRLLSLLNASFRQRLDEQHPTKEGHSANLHMQAILSSPLLLNSLSAPRNPLAGGVEAESVSLISTKKTKAEPVAIMQDIISRGKAELETMKRCLLAQSTRSAKASDFKVSMKNSKAGSITLHWLWSTGLLNSLNFLADHVFTRCLIRFLVAEGRYHLVFAWLNHDYKTLQRLKTTDDPERIKGRIILELTRAEAELGNGFSAAINIFIKLLLEWETAGKNPTGIRNTFSPSGKYLMNLMESNIKTGVLVTSDYDSFQKATNTWSKEHSYERAWLAFHHPLHPDAQLTVSYLRNLDSRAIDAMHKNRRTGTVDLALEAAEQLLSQDKREDVVRVMEVLRMHFSLDIGQEALADKLLPLKAKEEVPRESINVQLLKCLNVG